MSTLKVTDVTDLSGNSQLSAAGSVCYFAGSTAPSGWLKCNGASLSTTTYSKLFAAIGYTYGGSGASFNVPDLRGEFVRGWDDGRGVDSGRAFGSFQSDLIKQHLHNTYATDDGGRNDGTTAQGGQNYLQGGYNTLNTGTEMGAETRPRNIALLACIKFS